MSDFASAQVIGALEYNRWVEERANASIRLAYETKREADDQALLSLELERDELRDELDQIKLQKAGLCWWTQDFDGAWDTTCGEKWCFDDPKTPTEHGFVFCQHCGSRVAVVLLDEEVDDED